MTASGLRLSCDRQQKEDRMRWVILGTALSAVAAPALAAEFMQSSTEVKSGSPMGLAQVFSACNGQNISPALLVGRAARHAKLRGDDLRS
jgi:hypothetical protein